MAWTDITGPTWWTSINSGLSGQTGNDYIFSGGVWHIDSHFSDGEVAWLAPTAAAVAAGAAAIGLRLTFVTATNTHSSGGSPQDVVFGYFTPGGSGSYSDDSGIDETGAPPGTVYIQTVATYVPLALSGAGSKVGAAFLLLGSYLTSIYDIHKIELQTTFTPVFWQDFVGCHEA